jgi:hypothetical protein
VLIEENLDEIGASLNILLGIPHTLCTGNQGFKVTSMNCNHVIFLVEQIFVIGSFSLFMMVNSILTCLLEGLVSVTWRGEFIEQQILEFTLS